MLQKNNFINATEAMRILGIGVGSFSRLIEMNILKSVNEKSSQQTQNLFNIQDILTLVDTIYSKVTNQTTKEVISLREIISIFKNYSLSFGNVIQMVISNQITPCYAPKDKCKLYEYKFDRLISMVIIETVYKTVFEVDRGISVFKAANFLGRNLKTL